MANEKVIIYSDGACSGNPGPGGWGAIISDLITVTEAGGGSPSTTNNRMEMTGVIEALKLIEKSSIYSKTETIQIFTDSVYVIRGITQWIHGWKKRGWKNAENEEVSNQDLWQELDLLTFRMKSKYKFIWSFVKGHAGVSGNERCDEIAVAFSKNDYVNLYEGSATAYSFDITELPEIRPLPEMKSKSTASTVKAWYISYVNGVFTRHQTWAECEALVKGRPAKFKKVTSEAEEDSVKKTWGIS